MNLHTRLIVIIFSMIFIAASPPRIDPGELKSWVSPPLVRKLRPFSLTLNFLGKAPLIGVLVEMNPIKELSVGIGYGHVFIDQISGGFIPLYLKFFLFNTNLSPFVEAGLDFLTVKFETKNHLLNSTFQGTQVFLGFGTEYRFNFGLLVRGYVIRFIDSKFWSPGVEIGYCFKLSSNLLKTLSATQSQ